MKKRGKAQKERERKERQKERREESARKNDADIISELHIGQKVTLSAWGPNPKKPGIIVDIDEYPDESGPESIRFHVKWSFKRDGSSTTGQYRRESLQPVIIE